MSSVERFLRLALGSAFFSVFALHATAQVTATAPPLSLTLSEYNNRWDAFGGFSYARFNTTVGHALTANLMGVKVQATGWMTPVVGVTASFSQYYGNIGLPPNAYNITNPQISEAFFLFGPEVRLLRAQKYTVAYHFLLGGAYGTFDSGFKSAAIEPNAVNLPNNQLAFALATGAAFDYNLTPKWAVRVIADFQPTHYGTAFQKDFSGSAGVVYKWGAIKK